MKTIWIHKPSEHCQEVWRLKANKYGQFYLKNCCGSNEHWRDVLEIAKKNNHFEKAALFKQNSLGHPEGTALFMVE